jgi:hypothetical protein
MWIVSKAKRTTTITTTTTTTTRGCMPRENPHLKSSKIKWGPFFFKKEPGIAIPEVVDSMLRV